MAFTGNDLTAKMQAELSFDLFNYRGPLWTTRLIETIHHLAIIQRIETDTPMKT